ncbi:META domain-containing protein [Corynebacterium comes]|uniref:META domain-containing protein n=1 Tax=Corynebacterium comes TaxID=2675218 RepID=A0A6B8VZ91_9CORY|nr:META domain-containing protein [Corynebacterium comes]QGU05521.1 hypothetical protein CETAM_11445 [Corynebacterium comes]
MRRPLSMVGAGLAATLLLAGCSSAPTAEVAGSTWLVTDIWTTPGEPSALPEDTAGRARLAFGERSVSGHTGCAPFQGTVRFSREGEETDVESAHTLTVDRLEVRETEENCSAAWSHGQLTGLIEPGAVFDVRHDDRSLVLTLRTDAVDRPAIGLSAI